MLTCLLPVESRWLNPMETHWIRAKREIAEPDGEFSAPALIHRLCAYFQVELNAATLR